MPVSMCVPMFLVFVFIQWYVSEQDVLIFASCLCFHCVTLPLYVWICLYIRAFVLMFSEFLVFIYNMYAFIFTMAIPGMVDLINYKCVCENIWMNVSLCMSTSVYTWHMCMCSCLCVCFMSMGLYGCLCLCVKLWKQSCPQPDHKILEFLQPTFASKMQTLFAITIMTDFILYFQQSWLLKI